MTLTPEKITLFACIPMTLAIIGGLLARFYSPKENAVNFLQHLVAGIVIGAVSIELIPKIISQGNNFTITTGFILGVIAMLSLELFTEYIENKGEKLPLGLIFGSAFDLFIDGLLIGVAFIAGVDSGFIIALSLSLCAFFLNLSVSATLAERKISLPLCISSIIIIPAALPLGAFLGSSIVAHLPKNILTETLAFGIAALLYLGIEELLGEAHKKKETPWITSAFFIGFLIIILFRV